MGKEKKSPASRLEKKVLSFDLFGQGVGFTVDDGRSVKGGWLGLIISFVILFVLVIYGSKKA
jgi:hypothetical protein